MDWSEDLTTADASLQAYPQSMAPRRSAVVAYRQETPDIHASTSILESANTVLVGPMGVERETDKASEVRSPTRPLTSLGELCEGCSRWDRGDYLRMRIWIFNQYSMPPEFGHLNRHYFFGKYLRGAGHSPVVFAGSKLHNTSLQMIEDRSLYRTYETGGYPFVFVRTCDYAESKVKRVWAMFEYYRRLFQVAEDFEEPDVIIGSSAHPLAAVAAIQLSKKYNCQCIVEVRDLWPESLVVYGMMGQNNPLLKLLYAGEKWIYRKADKIIFTMEGGKDYILERGWDEDIPLSKIYYLNNGVDLEQFNYDREHFRIDCPELSNDRLFKVVYAGSIRRVNHLDRLVDAAKLIRDMGNTNVIILVYGDGDQKETLVERCKREDIRNIVFKGKVDKKHIPYILSKSDLNILHGENTQIMRFGLSSNKLFDYFAGGRPILSDLRARYDLIENYQSGVTLKSQDAECIAEAITGFSRMSGDELRNLGSNALQAAIDHSFSLLTDELISIMRDGVDYLGEDSTSASSAHR